MVNNIWGKLIEARSVSGPGSKNIDAAGVNLGLGERSGGR